MAGRPAAGYRPPMGRTLPVIWSLHGLTYTGGLEIDGERYTLTGRTRTFAFLPSEITTSAVLRGPADRLRGLPVLKIGLGTGDVVHVASLGGAGSLLELAALVGARQPVAAGS